MVTGFGEDDLVEGRPWRARSHRTGQAQEAAALRREQGAAWVERRARFTAALVRVVVHRTRVGLSGGRRSGPFYFLNRYFDFF
jgi:hypothetical protein